MKKYKIKYTFEGNGEVEVMAENEEEARKKFFEGEFDNEEEWAESYEMDKVEEMNASYCEVCGSIKNNFLSIYFYCTNPDCKEFIKSIPF